MPFSFHGHDIFFIYYFPFKFLEEGYWNPYLFLSTHFPEASDNPYYPPFLFFLISFFLFFIKPFLPKLDSLFSAFESWNFTWQGNTIHFAQLLTPFDLCRTLFFFKLPFLLFDYGTIWILLKLIKLEIHQKKLGYKIWMLNPFVLHSCYALGQVDIMMTFLLIYSFYLFSIKKGGAGIIIQTFMGLIKTYTLILIPVTLLVYSSSFIKQLKLSGIVLGTLLILVFPFYFSSQDTIMKALFFSTDRIPIEKTFLFLTIYTIFVLFCFFKKPSPSPFSFVLYNIPPLLFFFSFYTVTLRFFILLTPLLLILALKMRGKRFWIYNLLFFISLFELKTGGNSQQWGLFPTFYPEFMSSLPILDSFLNLGVDTFLIHRIMHKIFILTSFFLCIDLLRTLNFSHAKTA